MVFPNVINKRQCAFLSRRNILQSVVVANEVVDEEKRKKKECLFFNVNFEKAYDSIN